MTINISNKGLEALATASTTLEIMTSPSGTVLLSFPTTDQVTGNSWVVTSADPAIAMASGTPGYARLVDGSGGLVLSGDVGLAGSPWISLGPVVAGQGYQLTSLTITG